MSDYLDPCHWKPPGTVLGTGAIPYFGLRDIQERGDMGSEHFPSSHRILTTMRATSSGDA
jgi:hypothetical protein